MGNCLKCSKLFKVEIIYLIFCKNWLITWHNCCWFSFLWGLKWGRVLLVCMVSTGFVTFKLGCYFWSSYLEKQSIFYTPLIWFWLFEVPINILSSRSDTQSKFAWNYKARILPYSRSQSSHCLVSLHWSRSIVHTYICEKCGGRGWSAMEWFLQSLYK